MKFIFIVTHLSMLICILVILHEALAFSSRVDKPAVKDWQLQNSGLRANSNLAILCISGMAVAIIWLLF